MENLLGFPFETPQKCFELDIAFLIDWKAEAEKHDREWAAQKREREERRRLLSSSEVSDVALLDVLAELEEVYDV